MHLHNALQGSLRMGLGHACDMFLGWSFYEVMQNCTFDTVNRALHVQRGENALAQGDQLGRQQGAGLLVIAPSPVK